MEDKKRYTMKELLTMNSSDIDNLKVEVEKEEGEMLKNMALVEQAKSDINRKIANLRVERHPIDDSLRKAKYSHKDLKLYLSLLNKAFWASRNSGG